MMTQESLRSPVPELVRAIGRWSMVALAVNCILGGGIFGLPSLVAGLVGRLSPLAVLLAGVAVAVIVGCYAEVASQFTENGGHYLYVRRAFGRFAGLQVGWLNLLGRLTGAPRRSTCWSSRSGNSGHRPACRCRGSRS